MALFEFTAYREANIVDQPGVPNNIKRGVTFTMPDAPEAQITVSDDDAVLGGDWQSPERAHDTEGQDARITFSDDPAVIDAEIYIERVQYLVSAEDIANGVENPTVYIMADIEVASRDPNDPRPDLPGAGDDLFVFITDPPPAGMELVVTDQHDYRDHSTAQNDRRAFEITYDELQSSSEVDLVEDQQFDFFEFADGPQQLGTVLTSDPRFTDIQTIEITGGNDDGYVTIDPVTGMITEVDASLRPTEATGPREITVMVTDSAGFTDEATITLNGSMSRLTLGRQDSDAYARFLGYTENNNAGAAVKVVGDTNGDGIDDLLIGQPTTLGSNSPKISALYYGKTDGFIDVNDPQLAGDPVQFIQGELMFGAETHAVGDFDGDGYDDYIVSESQLYQNSDAFLIYGSANGPSYIGLAATDTIDPSLGFKITNSNPSGPSSFDTSYSTATGGGDFNGDGLGDILYASSGGYDTQIIFGVDGSTGRIGGELDIATLAPDAGVSLVGGDLPRGPGNIHPFGGDMFIGDVNGDGLDDVFIGFGSDQNLPTTLAGYVVYGSDDPLDSVVDLETLEATGRGFAVEASNVAGSPRYLGAEVGALGDINGDGYDDFAIKTVYTAIFGDDGTTEDFISVVYGSDSVTSPLDLYSHDGAATVKITRPDNEFGMGEGNSMTGVGDVNGDGIDDFAIGVTFTDYNGMLNAGRAYVVFGSDSGFGAEFSLGDVGTSVDGLVLSGSEEFSRLGSSVTGGDLNGDGFSDVVVSAQQGDPEGRHNAGEVFVVYGTDAFTQSVDVLGTDAADVLSGTAASEILNGAQGDDVLNGFEGDDILTGAEGADVFVFAADSGNNTVTDFGNGDVIDLSALAAFTSADDVRGATTYGPTSFGDALIDLGGGNTVLLRDVREVDMAALTDDDFVFAVV